MPVSVFNVDAKCSQIDSDSGTTVWNGNCGLAISYIDLELDGGLEYKGTSPVVKIWETVPGQPDSGLTTCNAGSVERTVELLDKSDSGFRLALTDQWTITSNCDGGNANGYQIKDSWETFPHASCKADYEFTFALQKGCTRPGETLETPSDGGFLFPVTKLICE
jgi:hypothetical protein